jgi:hypothetical protein
MSYQSCESCRAMIQKIVSTGSHGADSAALNVALRWGFPHGGWCPKGKALEDGTGARFQLDETSSADALEAAEWNVRDSDATVIFTISSELFGESKQAMDFARSHRKPALHLAARGVLDDRIAAESLRHFLEEHTVRTLNVTGSLAAHEPEVWKWTYEILEATLFWEKAHPNIFGGPGEG